MIQQQRFGGTVFGVYGARFRQEFTLEDAIGPDAFARFKRASSQHAWDQ
jgi:hypothetical protein